MRPTETVEESIYSVMRKMDKNTKLIVPIENWALARNYAAQLENDFDAEFSVCRMRTNRTKKNFILVERID